MQVVGIKGKDSSLPSLPRETTKSKGTLKSQRNDISSAGDQDINLDLVPHTKDPKKQVKNSVNRTK